MPMLLEAIAGTVDTAMEKHVNTIPPIGPESIFIPADLRDARDNCRSTTMTDDRSVARLYNDTTATYCEAVASMLGIHPHASDWLPALMWTQEEDLPPQPPGTSVECYSIRMRYDWRDDNLMLEPELMEGLDETTVQILEDVAKKFSDLTTWQIGVVYDQMEEIFRDIDRVISTNRFQFKTCQTHGHISTTSTCAHTPDARFSPWTIGDPSPGSSIHDHDQTEHLHGDTPGHHTHLRHSMRSHIPSSFSAPSARPDIIKVKNKSINAKPGVNAKRRRSSPRRTNIREQVDVHPAVEADYQSFTVEDLLQHVRHFFLLPVGI
jgi:hypothetical protein